MQNVSHQSVYRILDNDIVFDNRDKEYVLRVKDLADEDKPRERLIKYGPEALSSPELLAIVLNVGTRKEGVLSMTSRVLKEYGEKGIISQTNPKILEKELNVPLTKACQIVACFELGKRFFKKNGGSVSIRTARQAYEYLSDMRNLPKEHLRGLYLSSRHKLIHDEVISVGTLTSNIVHPREVFRPALEYSAAAVIIAHNHPSGSTEATKADIDVTRQIVEAGKILGIDILDHLVIAKNRFASVPVDYSR